jgi:ribonuclease-3
VTEPEVLESVERILGYQFQDQALLRCALTHASSASHRLRSNERLEFLGDAILGRIVCEEIYHRYPNRLEGELTQIKSAVVSRKTCAEVSKELGLIDYLFLGKGMSPRGQLPDSLAAGVLEALIAAMYLDCRDVEQVRRWVLEQIGECIEQAAQGNHYQNYKSQLQQHAQQYISCTPTYELLDEQGPDHHKCFEVCVEINGRRFASAWGPSKKEAEQKAAHNAIRELDLLSDADRKIAPAEDEGDVPAPHPAPADATPHPGLHDSHA